MSDTYDLEYSNEALLSRVLFLSYENDINIFVEDIKKEFEYEELFERLFDDKLKIGCIFPVGGKLFLEQAFELFGNSNKYGKTFFIADGDFDEILGRKRINAINFIYLKKYNIESYLIDETAVISIMRPNLRKTKLETRKIVNYMTWYNAILPYYKKLFILHCLVQKYIPQVPNISRKPEGFLDKYGLPVEEQYKKYKNEISTRIENFDEKYTLLYKKMDEIYEGDETRYICGKYLIKSLRLYLNRIANKKFSYDSLKASLISSFNIEALYYLKKQFIDYIMSC